MNPIDPAVPSSVASFAQHHPLPILELTPDRKVTFFNEAAARWLQSTGSDSFEALLPAETGVLVQACLASSKPPRPGQSTVDGRTFSWVFFPTMGRTTVHCHVTDVTERLKLESQLRHSQRQEAVGRLASGVAHDFNNILTVIQGHVGLMKSNPDLNPSLMESLQQVAQATERARKLTGTLLAFSRKSEMQPGAMDLNETLTDLSMILHRTLGEDIDHQFSYASNLPRVYADRAMVEQLVIILSLNARDAMPSGGQLMISTSLAAVDEAHANKVPGSMPGRFGCLTMVDGGCGMDHVTLSRIFEPFFTTKEFGKGTGLGLAVVDNIVKQHGGWIEVQSVLGQGSTFRVYLPLCTPEQDQAAGACPSVVIKGGDETVMVVEDEAPVRWIVRSILERYGYRVLEAGSGVEALAVWHQHHESVALLLTDMVMPVGLSGQELAEKFVTQKRDLKVIYTSGYSAQIAGKNLALTEGVNFLQKPFDADKLTAAIRKSLD